jgi:uncharacterized protein YutE (UPF0331/DUF86 family)
MTLKHDELTKIFEQLDRSKPIVRLTRGMNNKETYFQADEVWRVLQSITEYTCDVCKKVYLGGEMDAWACCNKDVHNSKRR